MASLVHLWRMVYIKSLGSLLARRESAEPGGELLRCVSLYGLMLLVSTCDIFIVIVIITCIILLRN